MAPGILLDDHSISDFFSREVGKSFNLAGQKQVASSSNSLAWNASTFTTEAQYTLQVTQAHNLELAAALEAFLELELDGHEIHAENFQLPTLGDELRRCAVRIHSGMGFVNIRGIDFDRYTNEDSVVIFLGISSYIGEKRARQDDQGNMIMHIRNANSSTICQSDRPTRFSNRASTFHTDPFPDILGLLTRSCAAKGGNHIISSAVTIYDAIAATRPDILDVLAQPNWPFDSPGGLIERTMRPILFKHGDHIIFNYAREPLIGLPNVPRTANFPSLTPIQLEALDMLEATAKSNQLVLNNQPGDLTFFNNHALLHSREAFEDEGEKRRYLVRLWLRNEKLAWKLPTVLRQGNERLYTNDSGVEEFWNVVPLPRLTFTVAERLCS